MRTLNMNMSFLMKRFFHKRGLLLYLFTIIILSSNLNCKKKKEIEKAKPSHIPQTSTLHINAPNSPSALCFPPSNYLIDITVWTLNSTGNDFIRNQQYSKTNYNGSVQTVGEKLVIPDFNLPQSGKFKFKIEVRIEDNDCKPTPCCTTCTTGSNTGRLIWSGVTPILDFRKNITVDVEFLYCRCCD